MRPTAPSSKTHDVLVNAARDVTLAEICIVALAEAFRGDGEVLCNPISNCGSSQGRLGGDFQEARPDAHRHDCLRNRRQSAARWWSGPGATVESYMPFRSIFDQVWSGKRHVVMGAPQIDRHGNQNFAAIGDDYRHPKVQLLGTRRDHREISSITDDVLGTNPDPRSFVETVDVISGPGNDTVAALPEVTGQYHEIRRVVTELGAYDFETDDGTMRIRSLHPGVTVEQAQAASAFELTVTGDVPESRLPTDEELQLIRDVFDPAGIRNGEFG